MPRLIPLITLGALLVLPLPAAAQGAAKPERVFFSISGGVQAGTPATTEDFTYEVNAEDASVNVRYPSPGATLIDGTAGVRLFRSVGVAVSVSRAGGSRAAQVDADIPHPFFDDRDRTVSGETARLDRRETAVHGQLYVLKVRGRWRVRVLGGVTHFRVERDTVTAVNVHEDYPYDTAEFASAETTRASGSAIGFNAAADAGWMFNRRLGVGALVRYTRGSVDLDAGGGRHVSVDAGGVQAAAGLRIIF